MNDTKLAGLLKTFSTEEWKEFEKFAASPYFNKGRNYLPVIKLLKNNIFSDKTDSLNKANIYKKLYPGKAYKESVINTISSGLYGLAEEFLIIQSVRTDEFKKKSVLIRELSSRGLKNSAEHIIRKINGDSGKTEIGFDDYSQMNDIYAEIYGHYLLNNEETKFLQAMNNYNLNLLKYMLHEFYAIDIEIYFQRHINKKELESSVFSKVISNINFEKLIDILEKEDPGNSFLLSIFYYFRMAVKHPAETSFYNRAKELTEKNYNRLNTDLKARCYTILNGIANAGFLTGSPGWDTEMFELLKKMLEDKLYIISGGGSKYMTKAFFLNMVTTALLLKEIDWIKNFVNENIKKTDPGFRKQLFNFCEAKISFEEKDYTKTVQHIQQAAAVSAAEKIELKALLSKVYYETGSIEPLYSLLDTNTHFIKNSGIKSELTQRNLEFIRLLRKLLNIKTSGTVKPEDTGLLKSEILKSVLVISKSWLLEKITELEKNNKGG